MPEFPFMCRLSGLHTFVLWDIVTSNRLWCKEFGDQVSCRKERRGYGNFTAGS